MRRFASVLTLPCLLVACAAPVNTPAPQSSASPAVANGQKINIQFKAEVNGQPFACGQSYTGLGSSKTQISPLDFRLYLSQVQLINAQGQAVPVQLEQDGKWQHKNLALLDFEDKTGTCEGTPETHFEVSGTVPAGTYKGLKFELGVPFDLNHGDVNQAASPLNLTSLFWVWRSGYKFARLDLRSTGQPTGWFLHLGSTGCTGMPTPVASATAHAADMHVQHETAAPTAAHGDTSDLSTTPPANCAQPNRVTVNLPEFEVQKHTVVADLGKLLADSNLDQNQVNSAGGCMSAPDDADCAGVFKNFGLPFGKQPITSQTFFAQK